MKETRTTYKITHPDGSVSQRRSTKPVRFAVVRGPASPGAWKDYHAAVAREHLERADALEEALRRGAWRLVPAGQEDVRDLADHTTHRLSLEGAEEVAVPVNRKGMAEADVPVVGQLLVREQVRQRVEAHRADAQAARERSSGEEAPQGWEVVRWGSRRDLAQAALEKAAEELEPQGFTVALEEVQQP